MPKTYLCPRMKAIATELKINLSKAIFHILEAMGLETEKFDLNVFSVDFRGEEKDGDCMELCVDGSRRKFQIRLKKQFKNSFEFLFLLAHELKHVAQIFYGELKYSPCRQFVQWQGGEQRNLACIPYRFHKWEIAANRAGEDLASFITENKKSFFLA